MQSYYHLYYSPYQIKAKVIAQQFMRMFNDHNAIKNIEPIRDIKPASWNIENVLYNKSYPTDWTLFEAFSKKLCTLYLSIKNNNPYKKI